MVKHSKNVGHEGHFTYAERQRLKGVITDRLGTDSQLPFGYCALSLSPIEGEAVISPSGHMYSKEAIYEYLLQKSRDLKALSVLYDEQELKKRQQEAEKSQIASRDTQQDFLSSQTLVGNKRSLGSTSFSSSSCPRKKVIDDTTHQDKVAALQKVSPWIVQFTPTAAATDLKKPLTRPPSPNSFAPLRAKDLLSLTLHPDPANKSLFLCPVSKKTVTSQPVVYIKPSRTYLLEEVYRSLALPSLTCPLTGMGFGVEEVVVLKRAGSSFSGSGKVEGSRFKHEHI